MLASINPLGERARNQSYALTVTAHVVASTVAAALLGGTLGLAGSWLASWGVRAGVIAAVALGGLLFDAHVFGWRVPGPRRQVNEDWLATYRGWVYGAAYGAQLGAGFTTIVAASATWLAFVCALFAGSFTAGAIIGAAYGFLRAALVLLAFQVRDASSLRALLRRLERV